MVLPTEADAVEILRAIAARLEAVALGAELVQADRAYLTATASRLRALAESLDTPSEAVAIPPAAEPQDPPHRPGRTWTRREAARRAKVAPNTLINMEERGLLTPRRDERGWRVYTKADIDLARTHLRQRPPLPDSE